MKNENELKELKQKEEDLKSYLASLESLAVAFSGGVDSSYLLAVAQETLGDRCIAVTARSHSFPLRELEEAQSFCRSRGIRHFVIDSEELSIEGFSQNPLNRCYLCKTELFQKIAQTAASQGIKHLAEGSNLDDNGDYRPGLTAVAEQGVKSPLREAGLSKGEIRELSRERGLASWNKPSFACLASRFPYGQSITPETLARIDSAEQFLLDQGFRQVRVRHHGNLARIETDPEGFEKFSAPGLRESVHQKLKEMGYTYIALDLLGYRTGSMNETLPAAALRNE
ncbi:MAG: ATP-dependent sacrificial sulfur transferase LarE [Spirochaetales bacterium]|jgi:uncharacterized protein|nr:ATP-dependent sacrificial sulfur transferase LarE [Spirochaetales bacterium]